jgi:hypothetical protein
MCFGWCILANYIRKQQTNTTNLIPPKIMLFHITSLALTTCKPDKEYTNTDVIDNYNEEQSQILALKRFYNSIVPSNKFIEIEFDDNDHLFRFGIFSLDSTTKQLIFPGFLQWDLKTNSATVKSTIATIGWTQRTLETLKQKLDNANCISIESGEPCRIGFQRRYMGKYYYRIFDKPMSDSFVELYKKECAFSYYNRQVTFEWGGGAIGGNCYPTQ